MSPSHSTKCRICSLLLSKWCRHFAFFNVICQARETEHEILHGGTSLSALSSFHICGRTSRDVQMADPKKAVFIWAGVCVFLKHLFVFLFWNELFVISTQRELFRLLCSCEVQTVYSKVRKSLNVSQRVRIFVGKPVNVVMIVAAFFDLVKDAQIAVHCNNLSFTDARAIKSNVDQFRSQDAADIWWQCSRYSIAK